MASMTDNIIPRLKLNSGYYIPVIGLGTFYHKPLEMERTIKQAIRLGYRHFDCAYLYPTEEEVGTSFEQVFALGEVNREDLFVTSKLPMNGLKKEKVEYFLRKSLSKLKLNYIDLYLVHAPFGVEGKDDYDFWPIKDGRLVVDRNLDLVEVWKGMENLVEKGLTRSIGLSNFNSEQIEKIYNISKIKPAVLQVECHPYLTQLELLGFCQERNIVFTAFAPLGSPRTAYTASPPLPLVLDDPVIQKLSEKYQKTPAQIVIRWAYQRRVVVVPNTIECKQLKENIDIFDFMLSKQDLEVIENLNRNIRIFSFNTIEGTTEHPEYPFKIPF